MIQSQDLIIQSYDSMIQSYDSTIQSRIPQQSVSSVKNHQAV